MEGQEKRTTTARDGKYLTFTLAGEHYGIAIPKVRGIVGVMPITRLPQSPGFVKGVMNLRGEVVPVVDLRLKFGMSGHHHTERTCIIVVEIANPSGSTMMGVVVDSLSQVSHVRKDDIEETAKFGAGLNMEYILGIARTEGHVHILLDIDRLFGPGEFPLSLKAA